MESKITDLLVEKRDMEDKENKVKALSSGEHPDDLEWITACQTLRKKILIRILFYIFLLSKCFSITQFSINWIPQINYYDINKHYYYYNFLFHQNFSFFILVEEDGQKYGKCTVADNNIRGKEVQVTRPSHEIYRSEINTDRKSRCKQESNEELQQINLQQNNIVKV